MRRVFFIISFAMFIMHGCSQNSKEKVTMDQADIDAIKTAIVNAYIHGIHETQDPGIIKAGFHKDFAMLVPEENGNIRKVSVDAWLDFIKNSAKVENPELWESENAYRFDSVDLTDHAASVKIQVYKGKKHFSTDYMLLYKFRDGWKIVSKIFKLW